MDNPPKALSSTRAFGPAGADQLAALFVDMQHNGFLIAQTFFGLWLLPLGYLVIKSGYFQARTRV